MPHSSVGIFDPAFPAENAMALFFQEINGFQGGFLRQNDLVGRDRFCTQILRKEGKLVGHRA